MTLQAARADAFRALHVPGRPLILANVWDAGSAKAAAQAGAPALATSSWAVADSQGFSDGEQIPLDLVIGNLTRIAGATTLAVTIDLERGYGATPGAVGETMARAVEAGAIGCNLEDTLADGALRAVADQSARIAAARAAADSLGVRAFINARSDVFFLGDKAPHDEALLDALVARAEAYAAAGADGLFAPGLSDLGLIASLTKRSPLPVNVMAAGKTPDFTALAHAGAARISQGPGPYLAAMEAVKTAVKASA